MDGGAARLAFKGVAGRPSRASADLSKGLSDLGVRVADSSFAEVASVPETSCNALDAFTRIRSTDPARLGMVEQPGKEWELVRDQGGEKWARPLFNIDLGPAGREAALFGLAENGAIEPILDSRAKLEAEATKPTWSKTGPATYRFPLELNNVGWSGLLFLTGREPFDSTLIAAEPGERPSGWSQRFAAAAAKGGWKAEMVWFKTADRNPD
jgi:serine/threonine-protein kinase